MTDWDAWRRELGVRIGSARVNRGLTQSALATAVTKLGAPLARQGIAETEAGRRKLPVHELAAIAQALNLPVTGFLP
jgi:transcriptional regulator with XRE-family HTH domain